MIILKFGGTSVSTKESITTIYSIVEEQKNNQPIVVVSAIKGVTDLLLKLPGLNDKERNELINKIKNLHIGLINELFKFSNQTAINYIHSKIYEIEKLLSRTKYFTAKDIDKLVSYGEILSSYIIAEVLKAHKIVGMQIIATELIVTNENFGKADYLAEPSCKKINERLNLLIEKGIVPVITGFIGATRNGEVTTLGRGGSDYSASIIASALGANEIQIWTDVNGVLTADPRLVNEARTVQEISYRMAEVFANAGAKVLHPKTMKPAVKKKIPIRVLNTFNPSDEGTLIVDETTLKTENQRILGLTLKKVSEKKSKIFLIGKNLHSNSSLEQLIKSFENKLKICQQEQYKWCLLLEAAESERIVQELHRKLFF